MKKIEIKKAMEQFKELNPKEIHNWPLIPQAVIGVVLFIALTIAGVFFVVMDVYSDYQSAKDKETQLKQEYIDKTAQSINLVLYKKQLVEITQASDELLKQLPNRAEVEKLLIDINQAGVSRGLQFNLFKPNQEKLYEFYAELPINIRVTGSYEALGNFTADVSQLSRVVLLKDISLVSNKDGTLTMDATATTFRYLDPDEIEKQKQEKKKEKAKMAANNKSDS
jgi:type IV pilus assembly protein PilO